MCFSFVESTQGDFKYIKLQFLIDCDAKQLLIDPATLDEDGNPLYLMEINRSRCVKNRMSTMTCFMERQRGETGDVSARRTLYTSIVGRSRKKRTMPILSVAQQKTQILLNQRKRRQQTKARTVARQTDKRGRRISKRRLQYVQFMREHAQKTSIPMEAMNGTFSFNFCDRNILPEYNRMAAESWRRKSLQIRRSEIRQKYFEQNEFKCSQQNRIARVRYAAAKRRMLSLDTS